MFTLFQIFCCELHLHCLSQPVNINLDLYLLDLYLLVGLDNGDVARNINLVICFLIKAKWPQI